MLHLAPAAAAGGAVSRGIVITSSCSVKHNEATDCTRVMSVLSSSLLSSPRVTQTPVD